MTVFAVSMMKDEADICEQVIRHLFDEGVDHIIVADNLSTDGSRALLDTLATELPMTVVTDHEVGFYQATKMTALAEQAGGMGAEWIVPFDADEFWHGPGGISLHAALTLSPYDVEYAVTFERVTGRKPLPKVAFRYLDGMRLHQGNHEVDHPGRRHHGTLTITEYQYRSLEQVKRKVRNGKAAYDATDLPASEGAHWRELGALSDEQLEAWWERYQSSWVRT